MKEMYMKNRMKAIVSIVVALAFVMPITAVANFGMIGVISDSEIISDIENMVETSSNSDDIIISGTGVTWYVGSGPGNDSTTIQGGIDLAAGGDTVYVYNGTYHEQVIVNKDQLNLVGESRENVIVEGNGWGSIIEVEEVNSVSIDTFTVTNGDWGIYVYDRSSASNNNIINCNVCNNIEAGIKFLNSRDCNIIDCNVYNNKIYGIYLEDSSYSTLEGNALYDNGHSFFVEGTYIRYFNHDIDITNTVDGEPIFYIIGQSNLIFNETDTFGFLGLISCTNITVKNSDVEGIILGDTTSSTLSNLSVHDSFGFYIYMSPNNNIEKCTSYNNNYGIYLSDSSDNDITNCNIYNNSGIVYGGGYGIYLSSSSDNDITSCNMYNNSGDYGIYLSGSSNNNIANCNVYKNSKYGIYLSGSSNNEITNCNSYNNQYGISLSSSSDCTLSSNTLYDNGYNFVVEGTIIDDFYHYIDTSNMVNGKPIYYLIEQSNIELDENNNFGFLGLISCTNITAKNSDVNGILAIDTTGSTIFNVSSHDSGYGIYLYSFSDSIISNCEVYDNSEYGIYLSSSSNNEITNCNVYSNSKGGICLTDSSDNSITECNAYNNRYGIYLSGSSDNNIIANCDTYGNSYYGIYLKWSSNNEITNCDTYGNFGGGIYFDGSSNNNITNCNAYNNEGYAISIGRFFTGSSMNNNILNCNIYYSKKGIRIYHSSNSKLEGNTIYDNGYNFVVKGTIIDHFNHDIDDTNTVNGKPIYYLVGEKDRTLDETDNFGYLGLISCTNITAKNSDVCGMVMAGTTYSTISNVVSHDCDNAIYIYGSSNNNIINCDVYNSNYGIYLRGYSDNNNVTDCNSYNNNNNGIFLWDSSHNNIIKCNSYNNGQGMSISGSSNNNIENCDVYNNDDRGIYFGDSSDNNVIYCSIHSNSKKGIKFYESYTNLIHHNNFVNDENADDTCSNTWDDGSEGNYWSDYTGVDVDPEDGIGDTPYDIPGGSNQDRFPLMNIDDTISPVITDIVLMISDPIDTDVSFGWENVTCTVIDTGVGVKDVKLIVTNPNTITEEYPMINIPSTDTYYYNTTLTVAGEYTYHIWADDTSGNNATSSLKQFDLPPNWDVDNNGQVHFSDLMDVIRMYGIRGPDGWVREDVDNNGQVHFSDLMDIIRHYGEQWK